MRIRLKYTMALTALTALTACSTVAHKPSHEILDERTGNTLLVVDKALVFARERTDVAAHARDYVTLVAIEVDASGTYRDYLMLYRWSTVDRRMSAPPDLNAGALRILADGRSIDLFPLPRTPVSLTRRHELHVPDRGDIIAHAYAIDVDTLRFIATSRHLAVRMPQESLDTPFPEWEDGRPALAEFLTRAGVHN